MFNFVWMSDGGIIWFDIVCFEMVILSDFVDCVFEDSLIEFDEFCLYKCMRMVIVLMVFGMEDFKSFDVVKKEFYVCGWLMYIFEFKMEGGWV